MNKHHWIQVRFGNIFYLKTSKRVRWHYNSYYALIVPCPWHVNGTPSPVPATPLPVNIFPNKLASKISNNMWRNPPLSSFASFASIVSLTINQILQEIYLFSWSFIKSTNHQPLTNCPLTTYSPTNQPTTDPLSHQLKYHQPKQTWYHFKDLIIKKVFISQKINTAGKM